MQRWLDAEAALAHAQAQVGLIPEAAARTIERCARAERFDHTELGDEIARRVHPLVPVVEALGTGSTPCRSPTGSSTMPHNRNPMLSEAVMALCQLVTGGVGQAFTGLLHENGRDAGDAMRADAQIRRHLDADELDRLLDPANHLRPCRQAGRRRALSRLIAPGPRAGRRAPRRPAARRRAPGRCP